MPSPHTPVAETTQPPPPPNRRRRLFQFSLRTLLVLTTTLGVWIGLTINHARRQKQAVDAILKHGGWVDYAHQYAGGHWSLSETRNDKAEPPGPARLRNWLGDEYFVRPVGLSADLQPVGSSAEPPDDEDLVQIGVLTDLEFLSLDTAPGRGRIAGTGFAHLRNLRKLRYLMLGRQPITDEGLKLLEPLTELESLKLDEALVTDAGLQYLQPLNKLASLSLEHTRVSDVGLQDLKSLKQLSTLDLIGTQVTDAGLAQLNGLSNLKQVFLVDTKVTEEGVRQLRQALPKCDIFW